MIVVLDVETQKAFSQLEKADPKKLKTAFVGVLIKEEGKEKYLGFWESQLTKLWPILEKANLIVGYNILNFDYPVLSAYYPGGFSKFPTLDILEEFKQITGHRISLDKIAQATLGIQKSGNGLEAINLFEQGKLDKLKKYCLRDVEITYKIYEYGRKFGYLKYKNKWNNIREIKIDFRNKESKEAKVQMTLGG